MHFKISKRFWKKIPGVHTDSLCSHRKFYGKRYFFGVCKKQDKIMSREKRSKHRNCLFYTSHKFFFFLWNFVLEHRISRNTPDSFFYFKIQFFRVVGVDPLRQIGFLGSKTSLHTNSYGVFWRNIFSSHPFLSFLKKGVFSLIFINKSQVVLMHQTEKKTF